MKNERASERALPTGGWVLFLLDCVILNIRCAGIPYNIYIYTLEHKIYKYNYKYIYIYIYIDIYI